MNAKKAKLIRRRARLASRHLPERTTENRARVALFGSEGTQVLTECQRGAYKAMKRGKFKGVSMNKPKPIITVRTNGERIAYRSR